MKPKIKYLLPVFFLLFSYHSNAQKEVPKAIIKSKIIKMPKFPVGDFPKKSPAVKSIRIVQFVRDSVMLGYVLKGLDNQVASISPAKPLTEFLQNDLDKMYNDDYKKEGAALLFVLKNLRIGERTAFTEFSYLRFKADVYNETNDGNYKLISAVDTVFISESISDVTGLHGEEIEDALKLLLHNSLKQLALPENNTTPLSFDKIKSDAMPINNYPILSDAVFKDGEYPDFDAFLQNNPAVAFADSIFIKKTKFKFIRTGETISTDSLSIWGLCKNGRVYKYYNGELIPLEKEGYGFVISSYAANLNKRNSQLLNAAIFGGAVGGGVGGALLSATVKTENIYFVTSIPHITKPKKQPIAAVIDMETGEVSF